MNTYPDKKDLPLVDAQKIVQTLHAALSIADESPLLYMLPENADRPTPAQVAMAKEVILDYLGAEYPEESNYELIGHILDYMHFEFETLAGYLTKDREDNLSYIMRTYGLNWTPDFASTILQYADIFKGTKQLPTVLSLSSADLNCLIEAITEAEEQVLAGKVVFVKDGYQADTYETQMQYAGVVKAFREVFADLISTEKEAIIKFEP